MNISEIFKSCKDKLLSYRRLSERWKTCEKDIFIFFLIIIIGFLGFGLGRFSKIFENKSSIQIENGLDASLINLNSFDDGSNSAEAAQLDKIDADKNINKLIKQKVEKNFVASKNGTKYYFPWCSGVDKIKEENKIWFASKEDAKQKGYTPAKGCKGL